MSRDVNSEEIGAPPCIERCTSWEQLKNFGCFKNFDCRGSSGNWISLMLCVTSISIDPLFFYIPVIRPSCLELDTKLGIIAFILRSAVDLIYMIYVFFQRQADNSPLCRRLVGQYRSKEGYIDLLAVLPLPQVVIITIVLDPMGSIRYYHAMNVLKYFVYFQFVPRVIRIYLLLREATGITWAKAAFNLYLYLLSGHAYGALWYFYAVERATRCWEKNAPPEYNLRCPASLPVNVLQNIKQNCSTKSELSENKEPAYDFGIYKAVLESEVAKGEFVPKFVYCFRWGLQSLSCLAENLQTSADTWENIFTITITIASLVLFVFLIGNFQLYIQSGTLRSEEMKLKMREIVKRKPFSNLPKDLRRQVKKHLQETKGVDVENFLNNLPEDLRSNIKSKLGLKELLIKAASYFVSIELLTYMLDDIR